MRDTDLPPRPRRVLDYSPISYIFVSTFIACLSLYLVEQVLAVDYAVKTVAKILIFIAIPLFYAKFFGNSLTQQASRTVPRQRGYWSGLMLGGAAFLIILVTFYFTRNLLDLQGIVNELQDKSKITPANFLLVGLYITLVNSFLEEYFFRGFVFLSLYRHGKGRVAYIYSASLFAVYHLAIFKTWFSGPLMILALLSLVMVGFVFNWLTARSGSFINSWITHIVADSAIILIGLRLFGIL